MSDMTKFIHVGDIHAGKTLHNLSRNDDAEYAVSQIIDFAKKENVDFVLLAGDVFNQYNPDTEAIKIIFDFMIKELNALKIPIVMIAGNHDGHAFLDSYKTLAKYANMHLFIKPNSQDYVISIKNTNIICVPYVSHKYLTKITDENQSTEYASKMESFINALIQKAPKNTFNILLSHMMTRNAKITKSEYENTVSEFFAVNLNNIENLKYIDYVALGHVHKHQKISAPTEAYYTGSCFQIDFNEENQDKFFNFVILEEKSTPKILPIKFDLKNNLKTFTINTENFNSGLFQDSIKNLKGYARVIIDDNFENTRVLEHKLSAFQNKILDIRRKSTSNDMNINIDIKSLQNNLLSFYKEYYKSKYGEDLPKDLENLFIELEEEAEQTV